MKRFAADVPPEERHRIREGEGRALLRPYLRKGEMAGVDFVSLVTLDPGASIGRHPHPAEEEFYLVLEGRGQATLDGEAFPVGPGDAFLCRASHSHGLRNTGEGPLTFLAVLAPARNP